SSGIFGYPKKEALQVAMDAIGDFLEDHNLDVYLAVFDKEAFTVSEELIGEVASYLDANYVEEDVEQRRLSRNLLEVERGFLTSYQTVGEAVLEAPLDDLVGNLDEPFAETLLRLIDTKGKDDVDVYKKA